MFADSDSLKRAKKIEKETRKIISKFLGMPNCPQEVFVKITSMKKFKRSNILFVILLNNLNL